MCRRLRWRWMSISMGISLSSGRWAGSERVIWGRLLYSAGEEKGAVREREREGGGNMGMREGVGWK